MEPVQQLPGGWTSPWRAAPPVHTPHKPSCCCHVVRVCIAQEGLLCHNPLQGCLATAISCLVCWLWGCLVGGARCCTPGVCGGLAPAGWGPSQWVQCMNPTNKTPVVSVSSVVIGDALILHLFLLFLVAGLCSVGRTAKHCENRVCSGYPPAGLWQGMGLHECSFGISSCFPQLHQAAGGQAGTGACVWG